MKIVIRNKKYWITGITVSILGLILAKIIAPNSAPELYKFIKVLGITLGLAGLIIITFGTRRKRVVKQNN